MNKFTEAIRISLTAIWANKLRSFLTMLGMIIGISSVVSLISIGEGVKKDISRQITDLGSNLLFIVPGKMDTTGSSSSFNANPANLMSGNILTKKDFESIKKIEGVNDVSPMSLVPGIIKYQEKTLDSAMAVGLNPSAQTIMTGYDLEQGRFIQESDSDKNVVVLGAAVAESLFESPKEAIGQKIHVGQNEMVIIGTIKASNTSSIFGENEMSNICAIPLETANRIIGTYSISRIIAQAENADDILNIKTKIEEQILKNHGGTEDFSVMTQDDMLNFMDIILQMMTALITAIAAISLVVGGIGIMNIMLVSVSERTHEIGLRKAVGATKTDISTQFLIESIVISVVGAIIGLIISTISALLVAKFSVLKPEITLNSIILAVGVSFGVGIIFGLLPALYAARKNPIEALRWE